LFSYNLNGTWSDAFDDVTSGFITVPGNKTMYFHVAPYFQGETGTYQLQIQVTRTSATAVGDPDENTMVVIFPNPVKDKLGIVAEDARIRAVTVFDLSGRPVLTAENREEINVAELPEGSYLLEIETDKGVLRRRFVKTNF
ncbi:MAG: T9SS type A sorting domain-containing protein, partial [Bacteroidota bacterium]